MILPPDRSSRSLAAARPTWSPADESSPSRWVTAWADGMSVSWCRGEERPGAARPRRARRLRPPDAPGARARGHLNGNHAGGDGARAGPGATSTGTPVGTKERGPGFGTCPGYRVALGGDGGGTFVGTRFVSRV